MHIYTGIVSLEESGRAVGTHGICRLCRIVVKICSQVKPVFYQEKLVEAETNFTYDVFASDKPCISQLLRRE